MLRPAIALLVIYAAAVAFSQSTTSAPSGSCGRSTHYVGNGTTWYDCSLTCIGMNMEVPDAGVAYCLNMKENQTTWTNQLSAEDEAYYAHQGVFFPTYLSSVFPCVCVST